MKLSVIMQVYNEELCLPCSLPALLSVADECIILDGGADGPSTDASTAIIEDFSRRYPGKLVHLSKTYRRDDGAWDEPRQVNEGISLVTGDYLLRTHADIVFDEDDLMAVREIIERFSGKKYFYAPLVDFGIDTEHIILQGRLNIEPLLPREICHPDPVAIAMSATPRAVEVNAQRQFGITADVDFEKDILYMPHVRRFHYSYCKPMPYLVAKYVRCVWKGDFAEHGERLKPLGQDAIVREAVNWVRNLHKTLPVQPYAGTYPVNGEPLRGMNVMQGAEQFAEVAA